VNERKAQQDKRNELRVTMEGFQVACQREARGMGRNGLGSAEKKVEEGFERQGRGQLIADAELVEIKWQQSKPTVYIGEAGRHSRNGSQREPGTGSFNLEAHIPGGFQLWWWNVGATRDTYSAKRAFAPGTYPCCPSPGDPVPGPAPSS
jgi:hypothetical protein